MQTILELLTDTWNQIGKLPIAFAIAAASMFVGLILKRAKFFPNRFIPLWVVASCAIAYTLLGDAKKIETSQEHPRAVLAIYGIILGFLTWLSHKWVLWRIEKFLPKGFWSTQEFENGFDSDPPFTNPDDKKTKD